MIGISLSRLGLCRIDFVLLRKARPREPIRAIHDVRHAIPRRAFGFAKRGRPNRR